MLIEKLSPIRNERDSMFVDNEEESTKKSFGEMTNGGGGGGGEGGGEDLSIIEYGPGIVKKLRSRYQSLALRQYTARPSLRKSASLENCLDAVCAEELAATLESKISNGHHDVPDEMTSTTNGRQTRPRNRFLPPQSSCDSDSRNGSPVPPSSENQQQKAESNQQNGKSGGTRGRTSGHHDASARRDRMRRARSVDALHRTKREEEILEKFKHVVLPKEEIVIIEVSKPQQNGNVFVDSNGTIINSNAGGTGAGGEKRFPTRLLLTANNLRNSNGGLDQQTANRMRNLMISPEHELPPHDIVRETARIFEKNQENLNRRIGQALRLSKSASATGLMGSSPLQSPESPTHTLQKGVMAQSTSSSSAMQSSQDKSFSTTTAMANGPSSTSPPHHGQKQIGIIKPTLSNSNNGAGGVIISTGNNVNSNKSAGSAASVNGGTVAGVENNRVRSPILSPIIGFPNKPLLLQNTQKPPLSPKPIFTSSPKVTIPQEKNAGGKSAALAAAEPSPSTSPILIIDNRENNHRSLSPFKSESPIPRVKSPVSSSVSNKTATAAGGGNNEALFMRSPSPLLNNGKVSPPVAADIDASSKRLAPSPTNHLVRTKSPEGQDNKEIASKTNNKTVTTPPSNLQNGQQGSSDHHRQQVTKSSDQIPAPPPRTISPASVPSIPTETNDITDSSKSSKPVSQLRVHQKQKSSQKGGNGSMVFNFTSRKEVPDYIEDDGLRRSNGSQMGSGGEDSAASSLEKDNVDSKIIPLFEGANIIINGRSSIQKRPKSQKLSISFNEEATTTHEYPSESSFAIEEEPSENENHAPKKPSVTGSSSLGSYTPKTGGTNAYQLGSSYNNTITFDGSSAGHNMKKSNTTGNKEEEAENDFIEDYLKPNTESTTWSNEMSADILF